MQINVPAVKIQKQEINVEILFLTARLAKFNS